MTTQLLFCKEAVPVSQEQHAYLLFDVIRNYRFSGGVESLPLTVTKFLHAAYDFIVFPTGAGIPMPAPEVPGVSK